MIRSDRRIVVRNASLFALVITLILSIPTFFYLQAEKELARGRQMKSLERYALSVRKSIDEFSRGSGSVFTFPRSLLYRAELADGKGRVIFRTDSGSSDEQAKEGMLRYSLLLGPNRLDARKLLVEAPPQNQALYIKAIVATLLLALVIFFLSILFIRISMAPLERANRSLNRFFNDAMHELKTPLGVLQLNLEMLDPSCGGKILRRLRNSVQNIALIYEDVEYLIKHNYISYSSEEIDCSEFLRQRIEPFVDLAEAKKITIRSKIEPGIHCRINRIELQRIIDNTLSNAVKYSPSGSEIDVTLLARPDGARLCIRDRGVGIRDTEAIFIRYHREESVAGGFGIGLSIVRHICDKHGIRVTVESEPGKGSTFCYEFLTKKESS